MQPPSPCAALRGHRVVTVAVNTAGTDDAPGTARSASIPASACSCRPSTARHTARGNEKISRHSSDPELIASSRASSANRRARS